MFVVLPGAVTARTSGEAVLNFSHNHFLPAAMHLQVVAVCPLLWVL